MGAPLRERAEAWIAGDPDPETRGALREVLDADDPEALAALVDGRLSFGTAGLRAPVGPGPRRMNRAVVIRTTRGLADRLLDRGDAERGVVVGFDARPDSPRFALDVAGVLAAAGVPVRRFVDPVPTPLVAYAARSSGAGGAVVVTASHNPPADNGYKVYGPGGVQITPPADARIAEAIADVGPATDVPRVEDLAGHPGVERVGREVVERYLADIAAARPDVDADRSLPIVYTALHGVGGRLAVEALGRAGFTAVTPVQAQQEPDGTFPTVDVPNPEEPGVLDLAERTAGAAGAGLVLANDPDADRLAVEVPRPDRDGGPAAWRQLTGNQVGLLLADHLLAHSSASRPLVVSSVVSSPGLGAVAEHHGARWETTLTGFKWICRAARALREDGLELVLGYEEALGYTVGEVVADKDGIAAAVVMADLVASMRRRGRTVDDALADLARRDGLWVSHQHSVRRPGPDGARAIEAAMRRAGQPAPGTLGGRAVRAVTDFRTGGDGRPPWLPETPLVTYRLEGGRALVRPSGTEPKLKIYVDLRDEPDGSPARLEARLRDDATRVAADLASALGV